MTSTELNSGLSSKRPSSRVLKPPGGGHSDIFGGSEIKANPPRPKYNQQNSSNLSCVMNTIDPNDIVKKSHEENSVKLSPNNENYNNGDVKDKLSPTSQTSPTTTTTYNDEKNDQQQQQQQGREHERGRVPPGGFSSGFW